MTALEITPELEARLLEWVPQRRWFRAKSKKVVRVRAVDAIPLPLAVKTTLLFLRVEYETGADDYVLAVDDDLNDVLGNAEVVSGLLDLFGGPVLTGEHTTVRFEATPGFAARRAEAGATFTAKPVSTEQTNTSILYGNSFVLKILRQLDEGTSPDMEMGEMLTLAGYEHSPPLVGTIVCERAGREASTLGLMHRFTPNQGDAWTFTLGALRAHLRGEEPTDRYVARAELLGRRVGQMHAALASRLDIPAFAPEPLPQARRAEMVDAAKASLDAAVNAVARHEGHAARLKAAVPSLLRRLDRFVELPSDPIATRVHGDLHLGQVLFTGDDFVIIDFEGEPARPLAERKMKRSPFVDVAGMLRSFHYAAMTGMREIPNSEEKAHAWHRAVRGAFLKGWEAASLTGADLLTGATVLDFALLEKCIYEVNYEANNRPDWIAIPLEGLVEKQ